MEDPLQSAFLGDDSNFFTHVTDSSVSKSPEHLNSSVLRFLQLQQFRPSYRKERELTFGAKHDILFSEFHTCLNGTNLIFTGAKVTLFDEQLPVISKTIIVASTYTTPPSISIEMSEIDAFNYMSQRAVLRLDLPACSVAGFPMNVIRQFWRVECSSPSPPTLTLPLKVSITFC
jgi:hypothetical protein